MSMSPEEATAYDRLMLERHPKSDDETMDEWRVRVYGMAQAQRVLPRDLKRPSARVEADRA